MARAVISPKFQVVIPKEVREQAGLKVGRSSASQPAATSSPSCRSGRSPICAASRRACRPTTIRDETERF